MVNDPFAQLTSAAEAGAHEEDLALALDWDQTALDAASRVQSKAITALDQLRLLELEDTVRRRATERRTMYGDVIAGERT